jgi:ribosomal protein L29
MVPKSDLRMSAVAIAARDARRLVSRETERSGAHVTEAIRAVAGRLRSSPHSVWALLFRPPKTVSGDLLLALEAAVDQDLERQIRELEHELATRRAGARKGRRGNPGALAEVEKDIARLRAVLRGDRP